VAMVIHRHGLFGSSAETAGGAQQAAAAERCVVVAGTDLRGIAEIDLPAVARMLNDITTADEALDIFEQGLVDHMALERAMRGVLAQQVFVDPAKPTRSLVDPTQVLDDAPAGIASYAELIERSADGPQLRRILAAAYPDPLDVELALGLFQMRWDRVAPVTP